MINQFTTKNLKIIRHPTPERMGVGVFEFTDDYSVFHYGKMPDQIPNKGEAICRMAAMNLQLLSDKGIDTHLRKFISPNRLEVNLVRVIDPKKGRITQGERNFFIPLQVIFRNTLPNGSSVFKRLEDGTVTLEQLGLTEIPYPGKRLAKPLIEFTTKEEIDKYISEEQAKAISALSDEQISQIKEITLMVNRAISRKAESLKLIHADGKLEFAITSSGSIMLVDCAGTPDENRFIYKGFHIGKQVLRDYYATLGLDVELQKWEAMGLPKQAWPKPKLLPDDYISTVSDMYCSLCEKWLQTEIWGAPTLDEVIDSMKALYGKFTQGKT